MDLVRHLFDKGSKLWVKQGLKFYIVNESKRINLFYNR